MAGGAQGTATLSPSCVSPPHHSEGAGTGRGGSALTHSGAGGGDEDAGDGGSHQHGPPRALDEGHSVEGDLAGPPPRVPGPPLVVVHHQHVHQEAGVPRGRACGRGGGHTIWGGTGTAGPCPNTGQPSSITTWPPLSRYGLLYHDMALPITIQPSPITVQPYPIARVPSPPQCILLP